MAEQNKRRIEKPQPGTVGTASKKAEAADVADGLREPVRPEEKPEPSRGASPIAFGAKQAQPRRYDSPPDRP